MTFAFGRLVCLKCRSTAFRGLHRYRLLPVVVCHHDRQYLARALRDALESRRRETSPRCIGAPGQQRRDVACGATGEAGNLPGRLLGLRQVPPGSSEPSFRPEDLGDVVICRPLAALAGAVRSIQAVQASMALLEVLEEGLGQLGSRLPCGLHEGFVVGRVDQVAHRLPVSDDDNVRGLDLVSYLFRVLKVGDLGMLERKVRVFCDGLRHGCLLEVSG